jgi:hypothetical protein
MSSTSSRGATNRSIRPASPLDKQKGVQGSQYRKLRRQAQNGHTFTLAEIEAAVEADPPTRKVFAEMAAETRAGRDISIEEFATRAHVPPAFVVFLVQAFIAGFVDALAASASSDVPA